MVLLFAHGAALLGGGFVREGRQTGGGAEEVRGSFPLVGCLAFLQRLLTVGTGHLQLKTLVVYSQGRNSGAVNQTAGGSATKSVKPACSPQHLSKSVINLNKKLK